MKGWREMASNAHPAVPPTPARPVVEVVHGVTITDPYRWLEDGDSADMQAWTALQNRYTRFQLDSRPERAPLRAHLAELLTTGFVQAPICKGERCFYTMRAGGAEQPVLMVRDDEGDHLLIDPAVLAGDGTAALDWWYPSTDGRLVAYGVSEGGDEQSTLHVLDVTTGHMLPDMIARTRYAGLAWLPDSSGFYYTRHPAPGSVPAGEEEYHSRVFFHHLGDDSSNDPLIYADPDAQAMPAPRLSDDGRYLLLLVAHGWSRIEVYLRDLAREDEAFTPLTGGLDAIFDCVPHGNTLYILTNWEAPRYRVLKTPLASPSRKHWQEVIAEGDHAVLDWAFTRSRLALHTIEHAVSQVRLYDLEGTPRERIPLPTAGTVSGPNGNTQREDLLLAFTSFAYPLTAYRYSLGAGLELFRAPSAPVGLDPLQLDVREVQYPSKDGTLIHMFVVCRADQVLDGARPAVLTGYGGFNISRTPEFGNGGLHAWIEHGGVWALANLRGGSEYGEDWHRAGMLANKQNVFDDFIAAAEWLIANRYTNPDHLACLGGSNGGLLVGAAITQRPDLFRAAICAVPLLDMLRYHLFRIARLWIPEYGSSEDAEAFRWLYAYSPYHHVRPDIRYPATLLLTAEGDSRVDPLHARKMAALLQEGAREDRPVLLRVESRAGHGAGKPVHKVLDEQTDIWTFLAWQLGLDVS